MALSENVFPGYYHDLPAAVRSFTSSPLALCLTAAIALTLLFRLGARQNSEIVWNEAGDSIASAVAFLRSKAQSWKIAPDLVETSAVHARDVITYILEHHSRHPEGALRATYNGVELRVELLYQGTQTTHLPLSREGQTPIETALEDEEAAAYLGLRNFLRGLAVDRQQVKVQKDRVRVRLSYAV